MEALVIYTCALKKKKIERQVDSIILSQDFVYLDGMVEGSTHFEGVSAQLSKSL